MITFSRLGQYGRLGNQMFQYALLRGVEAATGWTAKIPADDSPGFRLPKIFQLDCPRLSADDRAAHVFCEPTFRFHSEAFEVADDTDFFGYFQSERYFAAIAARVRHEFRFRPKIAARAGAAVDEVRFKGRGPLVSLHVRRGDYVDNPANVVCPLEYYERARMHLPADARYIICSDDPAWCRGAFQSWPAWHCELDDAATLAVMSRCDHHILAASSFSWWGAWLNSSPAKRVIAPRTWFGPAQAYLDTSDLLPADWLRID